MTDNAPHRAEIHLSLADCIERDGAPIPDVNAGMVRMVEMALPDGPYVGFIYETLADQHGNVVIGPSADGDPGINIHLGDDGFWHTSDDGLRWSDLTIAIKPARVWVLTISHRHGQDISVHASEAAANGALAEYVASEWESEMARADCGDEPMPTDTAEAVAAYFDAVEGEWANIEEAEVK